MASSYGRFTRASSILKGPGSVQKRLASAYRTELQYVGPEGLDETTAYELEAINDELTKVEAAGDKDAIEMSANSLSNEEAQELLNMIRHIHAYLAEQPC